MSERRNRMRSGVGGEFEDMLRMGYGRTCYPLGGHDRAFRRKDFCNRIQTAE